MGIPKWLRKEDAPAHGGHDPSQKQACIMELVNLISPQYEIWGTDAGCVDDTLAEIAISVNDAVKDDDERKRLLRFAPRFLGTAYKENQKHMRQGAYKWAKEVVRKYPYLLDDDNYGFSNFHGGLKITKKLFKNWYYADTVINDIWIDKDLVRKLKNSSEKKLMNEAVKFFDAVLPEGETAEPNWDAAKTYFKTGKTPDQIEDEKEREEDLAVA